MQLPVHGLWPVVKLDAMGLQQFAEVVFVAAEVAERGGVLQGELKRFKGAIEADQADGAGKVACGAENGEGVGCRAETDIPDHEFSGMVVQPLAELELVDVKRLRLGDRADDGMECFAVRERVDAVRAAGEFDKAVFVFHNQILEQRPGSKSKTRNPQAGVAGVNSGLGQSCVIALSSAA